MKQACYSIHAHLRSLLQNARKSAPTPVLGQKSQIATVVGCGSATGQAIPPFIIFAAKRLSPLRTKDKVPGSRYAVSDNGWIDQDLFHFWLTEHFLTHAVSSRPLLLLVDGHSSHFKPDTIRFAKEHNIVLFCLPPHITQ